MTQRTVRGLGEPIPNDVREEFHRRFDAAIDCVVSIEKMIGPYTPDAVLLKHRLDLSSATAKLIAEVFGPWAAIRGHDEIPKLDIVCMALRAWIPAIVDAPSTEGVLDAIVDEIEGLRFGDNPEILQPRPRKRSERSRPGRLANYRLAAIQWHEFLKRKSIKPSVCKLIISEAFGADWDRIRKWPGLAAEVLSEADVEKQIELAKKGEWPTSEVASNYITALYFDGNRYRQEEKIKPIGFLAFYSLAVSNDLP